MALIIKEFLKAWDYAFNEMPDPRAKHYFLISSPVPMLIILVLYYLFVRKFGPEWMEHRQPFKLERLMIAYNILQIIVNLYLGLSGIKFLSIYSLPCEPVDYSTNEMALEVLNLCWIYAMTKVLDLIDTIFFVLRKKQNQVSFLHLYHHIGMTLVGWVGVKYIGGGSSTYLGYINCWVHVVMYGYYLLAVWNTEFKKKIWWKKYITQLQMFQFLCIAIIYGQLLFSKDCNYPKLPLYIIVPQNMFVFFLFADFYRRAYLAPKKKSDANNVAEKPRDD